MRNALLFVVPVYILVTSALAVIEVNDRAMNWYLNKVAAMVPALPAMKGL